MVVRTATEIDFLFCQQCSCSQSFFGVLILRDNDLKILSSSLSYIIMTKKKKILRSCPFLLHQYQHTNTAKKCMKHRACLMAICHLSVTECKNIWPSDNYLLLLFHVGTSDRARSNQTSTKDYRAVIKHSGSFHINLPS